MDQKAMFELLGVWIYATGTVIASLGVSPFYTGIDFDESTFPTQFNQGNDPKDLATHLGRVGNILQASGNGIAALGADSFLGFMGSEIGATGNLTVLHSLDPGLDDLEIYRLIVIGNMLQAYGAYLSGTSILEEASTFSLPAYGFFTQTVGNSLQAYGGYKLIQGFKVEGNAYIFFGSWIQTLGAIIVAYGLTIESESQTS